MTTELENPVNGADRFIENLITKNEALFVPGFLSKCSNGDSVFLGKGQFKGFEYGYERKGRISLLTLRDSTKGMHQVSIGNFQVFYGSNSVMANNRTGPTSYKFMVLQKKGNEFGIAFLIPQVTKV